MKLDSLGRIQLRIHSNKVLRPIFGPKKEITEARRKLRNEELHDLYNN
jgi:hypothetical protein